MGQYTYCEKFLGLNQNTQEPINLIGTGIRFSRPLYFCNHIRNVIMGINNVCHL